MVSSVAKKWKEALLLENSDPVSYFEPVKKFSNDI